MSSIVCRLGDKNAMVKRVQRLLHLYPDGIFGPNTEEAVIAFQKKKNLTTDGVVGLATWSSLLGIAIQPKSKRTINEIIVHCTATPAGQDYTVNDITNWHKKQGWATIGYHYVIYRDGTIHHGRNIDTAGAHCQGHNTNSIGVVYVGGVQRNGQTPADTRTWKQKEALVELLMELKRIYPNATIHGHRDFAKKACPSFDATREYAAI